MTSPDNETRSIGNAFWRLAENNDDADYSTMRRGIETALDKVILDRLARTDVSDYSGVLARVAARIFGDAQPANVAVEAVAVEAAGDADAGAGDQVPQWVTDSAADQVDTPPTSARGTMRSHIRVQG